MEARYHYGNYSGITLLMSTLLLVVKKTCSYSKLIPNWVDGHSFIQILEQTAYLCSFILLESVLPPLCNFFHIYDMVFHILLPFYLLYSASFLLSLDISLLFCDT